MGRVWPSPLLVVQPSADYAARIQALEAPSLLLVSPERAGGLAGYEVVVADLGDPASVLRDLRRFLSSRQIQPAGITCFVCEYLPLTAWLATRLGLPFPSEAAVRRSRVKSEAAAIWQAAGVPTPPSALVRSRDELLAFAGCTAGPWILKPVDRSGSEWVLRADSAAELPRLDDAMVAGLAAGVGGDGARVPYLVQTLVTGPEVGLDLWVNEGRGQLLRVTGKCLVDEPGVAGMVGAYFPARLDAAATRALAHVAEAAVAALGCRQGLAMADIVLTAAGPCVLEVAFRPGGDCLPDLCRRALGYDPIAAACQVALGRAPAPPARRNPEPLAAVHLISPHQGRIEKLGFVRLRSHPAFVELLEVYHQPGECLRVWPGSYDQRILAACLVRCHDPRQLPDLCRRLPELVDVELSPV
jgi:hypothetical protein